MKPRGFRWEVLLLGVLAAGLTVWGVFFTKKADITAGGKDGAETSPLQVVRMRTFPEGDHVRLEISLRYRNARPVILVCEPPAVRLLAGDGRELPVYFEAFSSPPEAAAGRESELTLEWWVTTQDLASPLRLCFPDKEVPLDTSLLEFSAGSTKLPSS